MNQYGVSGNLPDQEGDLVDNPRYQGQPVQSLCATGPQEESRYGAAPLSTGTENQQQQDARQGANPVAGNGKEGDHGLSQILDVSPLSSSEYNETAMPSATEGLAK